MTATLSAVSIADDGWRVVTAPEGTFWRLKKKDLTSWIDKFDDASGACLSIFCDQFIASKWPQHQRSGQYSGQCGLRLKSYSKPETGRFLLWCILFAKRCHEWRNNTS
eukprot:s3247_g8.t1